MMSKGAEPKCRRENKDYPRSIFVDNLELGLRFEKSVLWAKLLTFISIFFPNFSCAPKKRICSIYIGRTRGTSALIKSDEKGKNTNVFIYVQNFFKAGTIFWEKAQRVC